MMERGIRFALALIITVFILGASKIEASAEGLNELSDEALAVSARAIVTGRVARIESRWNADREAIYTDITIELSKVIKGEIKSDRIVIEQLGGRVGNRQALLLGSPKFDLGENVLLFLNTDSRGVLRTAQLSRGKVAVKKADNELNARPASASK